MSETELMFSQKQHEQELNKLRKSQQLANKQSRAAIKLTNKIMLEMASQMAKIYQNAVSVMTKSKADKEKENWSPRKPQNRQKK